MTDARPTFVRYAVLAALAVAAVFMYVDRVCLAQVKTDVVKELSLEPWQGDAVVSGFFWAYALAQVPAGLLAGRFGLRVTLACGLFLWSAFTALTGLSTGFAVLLACRLLVGLSEAAAYPTAASLVKAWFPARRRGFANSVVSLGGRLGGAAGQLLTPVLVAALAGWRPALILFGVLGMVWAVGFWLIVHDSPATHLWANDAEAALPEPVPTARTAFPFADLVQHRGLWCACLAQFGTNVGWAFLITNFPEYLEKQHGVPRDLRGEMAAIPGFVGCLGMFAGGFVTDVCAARLGPRWGRALPLGVALLGAAAAYLYAAGPGRTAWEIVYALCGVTVCVDLGVPALWAYAQDVGGRHTAATLGWFNMWGNLGAAASPLLLGGVQRAFGWDAVFAACAGAFFVAGVAGLFVDARRALVEQEV